MTTAKQQSPTLVVTRFIPFPRERVFDAWLDAKRLAQFMHPGNNGRSTVETDARVGGKFRIVMHHAKTPPEGVLHTGEYLLIERPSRLVFTWLSIPTENRATTVTVEFEERPGGTEVVLTHVGLPSTQVEGHRRGWGEILGLLESAGVS